MAALAGGFINRKENPIPFIYFSPGFPASRSGNRRENVNQYGRAALCETRPMAERSQGWGGNPAMWRQRWGKEQPVNPCAIQRSGWNPETVTNYLK